MPDQIIQDRLNILNTTYATFIESDYIDKISNKLGESVNLNTEQTVILYNAIKLYMLFFLDKDEMIDFLIAEGKIDNNLAKELYTVFIKSTPKEYAESHAIAYNQLNSTEVHELASEIAETEKALQEIPQMHTMASDMKKAKEETVYSSSQSDLLKRTPMPKPARTNDFDNPQWESARED